MESDDAQVLMRALRPPQSCAILRLENLVSGHLALFLGEEEAGNIYGVHERVNN